MNKKVLGYILVTIVAVLFISVIVLISRDISDINTNYYEEEIVQKEIAAEQENTEEKRVIDYTITDNDVNEVSFIYGFMSSKEGLVNYCEKTGYVPNDYVKQYNNEFSYTKQKMDKIINTMPENYKTEFDAAVEKFSSIEDPFGYEADYQRVVNKYSEEGKVLTKKEYCKMYDDKAQEIIQYKKQLLKEKMPEWVK